MTERAERLVQRGWERLPPGGRGGERAVAARAPSAPPPRRLPASPSPARLRLLLLCRRRRRRRRRLQRWLRCRSHPGSALGSSQTSADHVQPRRGNFSPLLGAGGLSHRPRVYIKCLGRTALGILAEGMENCSEPSANLRSTSLGLYRCPWTSRVSISVSLKTWEPGRSV